MKYILKLYIIEGSSNSIRAVRNLGKIGKNLIEDQCVTEIIDVAKSQKLAIDEGIVAVPTLIRSLPPPSRKVVGDLSNTEKVILGLDLGAIVKDDTKEE